MKALIVYFLGLLSLFIADVAVTKFFSEELIQEWGEIRSLIGLTGILCVVGFDYVIIRSPQSSSRILWLLLCQIPILSIVVGLLVTRLGFLSDWRAAVGLCAGSAASLCLSQYFRSHRKNLKSQIVRQAWKIISLVIIAWMAIRGSEWQLEAPVVLALLISVGAMSLWLLKDRPSDLYIQAPEPTSELYSIGSRFMATSLLLALAIYAEQLVVNALGTSTEAAIYFTHAAYFLFPISIANGYLAFLLGPWLRENHDRFIQLLSRYWFTGLAAAAAYTVVLHLVGWLGWIFIDPAVGSPDPYLQVIFMLSAFARSLYTFPSGYNGVFGTPRQHDILILGQVIILGTVGSFFFVVWEGQIFGLVYVVAIGSALNWLLRTALGFGITRLIAGAKIEK